MSEHTVCTASVWPHRHKDETTGPVDVKISYRHQPPIVRDWPKKQSVQVHLEQPDERTNLTIIKLSLCPGREVGGEWYRINQYRIGRDSGLKFYIKSRITNQMDHPIPRGRWQGTCEYTDEWCLFTLQALTLMVKPEEPRIVVP